MLTLAAEFDAGTGSGTPRLTLRLTNGGTEPLRGFTLVVTGPGRLGGGAAFENARLVGDVSNHTRLVPPDGFSLAPGATWTLVASGTSLFFRHWSDGPGAAYLVGSSGAIVPVEPSPLRRTGDNAPLRRGTVLRTVPADGGGATLSVIPWPEDVRVSGRRGPVAGLALVPQDRTAQAAAESFVALTTALFPAEALVRPEAEGGLAVVMAEAPGFAPEAYRVGFSEDAVTVTATTRTGLLYGLITLGQILRGAQRAPATYSFPHEGVILDQPRFGFRGTHLDVARQFYAAGEIRQFLAVMAWNKLNRFHWHLTDDEAWRLEIAAFPELTAVGAWRGEGLAIPPLLGTGPHRTGGFYTQESVREVVALGQSLGIEIIPEVDIPGHSYALLAALPRLRDPQEQVAYHSVQRFPENCLNPAREIVYDTLDQIFAEMAGLFPHGIIHVGADEVPLGAWSGSPEALALLEKAGGKAMADAHRARAGVESAHHGADAIEGSPTAVLQGLFLKRVSDLLAKRGLRLGGWEEAAHGDVIDKETAYLVGWRNVEISAALAEQGYKIVVSPGQRYYLDMSQSTAFSEPGAAWAGWSGPEETYSFDPAAGWAHVARQHLLGVQACIWSEPFRDRSIFDRLVFPRLSAIAESGWTGEGRKSYRRFIAAAALMPNLYGYWDGEA